MQQPLYLIVILSLGATGFCAILIDMVLKSIKRGEIAMPGLGPDPIIPKRAEKPLLFWIGWVLNLLMILVLIEFIVSEVSLLFPK